MRPGGRSLGRRATSIFVCTFIVFLLKKRIIGTHIDHTYHISLQGPRRKEFRGQESRKEADFGLLTSVSQRSTNLPWNVDWAQNKELKAKSLPPDSKVTSPLQTIII